MIFPITGRPVLPLLTADYIIGIQSLQVSESTMYVTRAKFRPTNRGILLKGRNAIISKDMRIVHTAVRPFMASCNPEPNIYYRPWLEENVGAQGVDWDWDISRDNIDMLEVYFNDTIHGTLFELTWQ